MNATSEVPRFDRESPQTPFQKPIERSSRSSLIGRDSLNYITTLGTMAMMNGIGSRFLYDVSHKVFDTFTVSPNIHILDQFRDLNTAVSVFGGLIVGDFMYKAWKKTKTS